MKGRALFAAIAPRLERAHRGRLEELARERAERQRTRDQIFELERLIAHRELQLQRANAVGDSTYIARRQRKLNRAVRDLARLNRRAVRIGA